MREGARTLIATELKVKAEEAETILQRVEERCKQTGSSTVEEFTGCVYSQIQEEKARRRAE